MSKIEKIAFRPRHRRQATRRAEREEGLRTPHPARVARLLALARDIEARIEAGEFRDYADVARAHGLTRARLTQVMNLLLAPPIQEDVLHLEVLPGREPISEQDLRRVLQSLVWEEQVAMWRTVLEPISKKVRRLDFSGKIGG
ncbi:MAG: hypothetical protein B6A08_04395 [Sorangiineae bacterium NIC37A_2]|nr:MAG: hypothetical protein B6A08_04395 [Sorangiineae bacterium NIC37A_2]